MQDKHSLSVNENVASSRGKYITLAILIAWVIAVFAFTIFKFSGSIH